MNDDCHCKVLLLCKQDVAHTKVHNAFILHHLPHLKLGPALCIHCSLVLAAVLVCIFQRILNIIQTSAALPTSQPETVTDYGQANVKQNALGRTCPGFAEWIPRHNKSCATFWQKRLHKQHLYLFFGERLHYRLAHGGSVHAHKGNSGPCQMDASGQHLYSDSVRVSAITVA